MNFFVVLLFVLCGLVSPSYLLCGGQRSQVQKEKISSNILREVRSLNGTWRIAFDGNDIGKQEHWYEEFPTRAEPIPVPSVWNTIRPNYQGVAWYQKSFTAPPGWQGRSVRIRFGAVNYLAEVWLNGNLLGTHEGGYTPFEYEASKAIRWHAENQLIVRVLVPPFTHGSLQRFPLQPFSALRQYRDYARNPLEGFDLEEVPASKQTWWGAEIGIETGSPTIAKKIMPAKAHPFSADNWHDVVVEGMGLAHDNMLAPACTIIVGLPDETEDDITKTMDLVDDLKGMRSLIVPLFFVPLGHLTSRDWFTRTKLNERHRQLLIRCAEHDFRWVDNLLDLSFNGKWYSPFMKTFYKGFSGIAKRKVREVE